MKQKYLHLYILKGLNREAELNHLKEWIFFLGKLDTLMNDDEKLIQLF